MRCCWPESPSDGRVSGLDGRAVQGASLRHWSLRRRGFESHSNHYIPVSLVGQDTRLSPARPGFKSRTGNFWPFSPENAGQSLVHSALECGDCVPPELRWQSGRLLTDRSSVRSRVEAHSFCIFFAQILPACDWSRAAEAECIPGVAQR